ncbi:hypothetical protein HK096_005893, partial [Nowakowskiella sp. JEL0078]
MVAIRVFIASLLGVLLTPVSAKTYFKETFDTDAWSERWIKSGHSNNLGVFEVSAGSFYADKVSSRGLRTTQDAKHYAITAPLDEIFDNKDKDLVIQFTVKNEQTVDCAGGYIKLIPDGIDPLDFHGETPYSIMFGPDICGDTRLTHAIINYRSKNVDCKKGTRPGIDQLTHLYTFILRPNQTAEVLIDNETKIKGNLTDIYGFLPPKEIKDPEVVLPEDWVVIAKIPDPNAVKPD